MRAFKFVSIVILAFSQLTWADEEEELPDPVMPDNPYGDIPLDEIIKTGTLDGVNKPSTPEEQKVFEEMERYYDYTEAIARLNASYKNLEDDQKASTYG